MVDSFIQNKKLTLISCFCIFIIGPFAGYIAATSIQDTGKPTASVKTATKQELLQAINQTNTSLPLTQQFTEAESISSFKQMETWWYIAFAQMKNNTSYKKGYPVLLSKFNDKDPIELITTPGGQLNRVNISQNRGVPYSVIDEYNKALDTLTKDIGE